MGCPHCKQDGCHTWPLSVECHERTLSDAAHKARIEFIEAMGQAHFSRTDPQWHVATFAKKVGADLDAELKAALLQNRELQEKNDNQKKLVEMAREERDSLDRLISEAAELATHFTGDMWSSECNVVAQKILDVLKPSEKRVASGQKSCHACIDCQEDNAPHECGCHE